jgi:uncharacterized protein (DUF305 family)
MANQHSGHMPGKSRHYLHFGIMLVLNFVAMYLLMYAMVNVLGNVYSNFNQVYMAGLMTAPMAIMEVALMRGMYQNKAWNVAIATTGVVLLITLWWAIRVQAAIGDAQFIRSMIPHHAGAILMCKEAPIEDAELKKLCQEIISGQQQEIDQMKAILDRLK